MLVSSRDLLIARSSFLDEPLHDGLKIAGLPEDRELYCNTTAMIHYAKGVAHAALGEVPAAEAELSSLSNLSF